MQLALLLDAEQRPARAATPGSRCSVDQALSPFGRVGRTTPSPEAPAPGPVSPSPSPSSVAGRRDPYRPSFTSASRPLPLGAKSRSTRIHRPLTLSSLQDRADLGHFFFSALSIPRAWTRDTLVAERVALPPLCRWPARSLPTLFHFRAVFYVRSRGRGALVALSRSPHRRSEATLDIFSFRPCRFREPGLGTHSWPSASPFPRLSPLNATPTAFAQQPTRGSERLAAYVAMPKAETEAETRLRDLRGRREELASV